MSGLIMKSMHVPKPPDAGSVSSMELCPKEVSLTSHSQQVLRVLVLKGNFR